MHDATHPAPRRQPAPTPSGTRPATPVWATALCCALLTAAYWLAGACAAFVLNPGHVVATANAVALVHVLARFDPPPLDNPRLRQALRLSDTDGRS